MCFDATSPRMGDVFALIVRYVEKTMEGMDCNILGIVLTSSTEHVTHLYFSDSTSSSVAGKAFTVHRLILLDFLESRMNSAHVCSAIQKGLASPRLLHSDVCAVSADARCSVNLRAHTRDKKPLIAPNSATLHLQMLHFPKHPHVIWH